MTYSEVYKALVELLGPGVKFCLTVQTWARKNGPETEWEVYTPDHGPSVDAMPSGQALIAAVRVELGLESSTIEDVGEIRISA